MRFDVCKRERIEQKAVSLLIGLVITASSFISLSLLLMWKVIVKGIKRLLD